MLTLINQPSQPYTKRGGGRAPDGRYGSRLIRQILHVQYTPKGRGKRKVIIKVRRRRFLLHALALLCICGWDISKLEPGKAPTRRKDQLIGNRILVPKMEKAHSYRLSAFCGPVFVRSGLCNALTTRFASDGWQATRLGQGSCQGRQQFYPAK